MKIKICLIILIAIITSCKSTTKQHNIMLQDKSFEVLVQATQYGFRGKDGQPFRNTDDAYQVLISSKNAKEIFIGLFEKGKTPGKLYALCALYKLDKNVFDKLSTKLNQKEMVYTQFGCVVGEMLVGTIVSGFNENNYNF